MEFSIIKTGGKQYKVTPGTKLTIEKLSKEHVQGDKVVFDKVLLSHKGGKTVIGTPFIEGATVESTFEKEGKGKKVMIVKYKAKSRYKKIRGHRQPFAKVSIAK
jgi:large subunit ribosomal protein L21